MWKHTSFIKKGTSHEKSGTECQDSVFLREDDFCIVAAVADGLGSLENSAVASSSATNAVWELFSSLKDKKIPYDSESFDAKSFRNELVTKIKDMMLTKALEMDISEKTMDCTLVFVYISKLHDFAVTGRLGDSAICIIKDSGNIAINDSNVSANGTSAMLDKDSAEQMHITFHDIKDEDIKGFILTSDGLDNEIYRKGSEHVNMAAEDYFNAPVLSDDPEKILRNKINMLTASEVSGFDDDISIAVITRAEKPVSFKKDPTWLCRCNTRNRLQDTYCKNCNADFSAMYQHIRFREHGGKTAFFIEINKDPEKERKIIGLPEKPFSNSAPARINAKTPPPVSAQKQTGGTMKKNNTSAPAFENQQIILEDTAPPSPAHFSSAATRKPDNKQISAPSENKPSAKTNSYPLIIIAITCFVAGVLITSIVSGIFFSMHNKKQHPPEEATTDIVDTTTDETREPIFEDSPLETLPEQDSKEDVLIIMPAPDGPDITAPPETELQTEEPSHEIVYHENIAVIKSITNVREHPGKKSKLIMTLLPNSTVYLLDSDKETVNGEVWVHIKTENSDKTGWIPESSIE
ncbi:MAG: hypothetical protein E7573_11655 [Ruminococcaceae bacterium]|nr:hypothetical protein [Oscillospiraceae bacterium]